MKLIYSVVCFLLGGGLLWHSHARVQGGFQTQLNVFELNQSPYGEVLGASLQDPVSTLFHNGQGHDHVHLGEDCPTCSGGGFSEGGNSKLNPIQRVKNSLKGREVAIRVNNLSVRTGNQFGRKQGLDIVKVAYELDPTNYGNYNMMSYFTLTSDLGGEDRVQAVFDLADRTIEVCERRPSNIYDAITAAVAEEIVLIYKTKRKDEYGLDVIKEHYLRFKSRVDHLKELISDLEASGEYAKYSEARRQELGDRMVLFDYNIKGYDGWFE